MIVEKARPAYDGYDMLHAEACRTLPRFVDPATLGDVGRLANARGWDWATAVLGRYYRGEREITRVEGQMLRLADEQNITPPLPAFVLEARAAAAARERDLAERRAARAARELAEWREVIAGLGALADLLEVRENPNEQPRAGIMQRTAHAVPTVDVVTPTRRHPAGRALCESTHRTRPLALNDEPVTDRGATCVRCRLYAPRIRRAAS